MHTGDGQDKRVRVAVAAGTARCARSGSKLFTCAFRSSAMTARQPISPAPSLDHKKLFDQISRQWDDDIIPQLTEYIRLPAKSPAFDVDWVKHGYLLAAIRQAEAWVAAQNIAGLVLDVIQFEGLSLIHI